MQPAASSATDNSAAIGPERRNAPAPPPTAERVANNGVDMDIPRLKTEHAFALPRGQRGRTGQQSGNGRAVEPRRRTAFDFRNVERKRPALRHIRCLHAQDTRRKRTDTGKAAALKILGISLGRSRMVMLVSEAMIVSVRMPMVVVRSLLRMRIRIHAHLLMMRRHRLHTGVV